MKALPLRATQRLQFHKGFTLDDAVALVPYFARLGISHLYASPLLSARAGSMHGYDVVDPTTVNPELGGEAALRRLVAALHRGGTRIRMTFILKKKDPLDALSTRWIEPVPGLRLPKATGQCPLGMSKVSSEYSWVGGWIGESMAGELRGPLLCESQPAFRIICAFETGVDGGFH